MQPSLINHRAHLRGDARSVATLLWDRWCAILSALRVRACFLTALLWVMWMLCGWSLSAAPQRVQLEQCDSSPHSYIKLTYHYQSPLDYRPSTLLLADDNFQATYRLQLRRGRHTFFLYQTRLNFTPHTIEIMDADSGLHTLAAECATLQHSSDNTPVAIIGGLDLLLDPASRTLWHNTTYQLFRWQLYPQILIIDTATYAQLSHFFKRLAFYIEKEGHQGTIYEEQALAGRYAWRGHNYNAEGLADFFQEAQRLNMPLNSSEQLLLDIALQAGILIKLNGYLLPGQGGILGISWESPPIVRHHILAHEMLHGIFYSVPPFREAIANHWRSLPNWERQAWEELLRALTYNPADPYLMVNEFHAYLMMYGSASAASRLQGLAQRALARAEYPNLRRLYSEPQRFQQHSIMATRTLQQYTGLRSPNLWALELLATERRTDSKN